MHRQNTATRSAQSLTHAARLIAFAGLAALASIALGDDHGTAHAPAPAHAPSTAPAAKPASKPTTTTPPASTAGKTAKPTTKAGEKPVDKTTEKPAKANESGADASDDHGAAGENTGAKTGEGSVTTRSTFKASGDSIAIENTEGLTADQALKLLTEGNTRWVAASANTPNVSVERRKAVAEGGQHPFVTVLTCADSRLPVERIFDRGVGDVFVVRVAGNIAGVSETGTIEYGIEHLKTPLLVIMGHTKCGAVNAAATHAEVGGAIAKIVDQIEPAVERASKNNPGVEGANLVPAAIKENVWQTAFDLLKNSHEVRSLVEGGKLKIVGAVCDIATGKVEWMGEHPWQKELISAFNAQDAREQTGGTPAPKHADASAATPVPHEATDVGTQHGAAEHGH
ncbi:MAG: carbonic anhydrase [Planctomycetota bacterium]|nr:carbonic anhydrase [Planctomycetota bacterium]